MLSKTGFLTFLEAPMHLWAKSHNQLTEQPPSIMDQHLAHQGQEIENLARQYIEQVLLSPSQRLFWQAAFDDGRYQIRADALILDQETGEYDLYEIKSGTSIRKAHEYDLAFQVVLLETLIPLRRASLLHIDNTYLHGQQLELEGFFITEDITDRIQERKDEVVALRREAWQVTQMAAPSPLPACTKPGSCPCPDLCHPDLPPNPIYNLPYLGKKALTLRDMGVLAIEEIPSNFQLSLRQRQHVEAIRQGVPIINAQAIQTSLAEMQYPLYFLDYETFNPAIPLFPGYQPYEQIVFQYALFVIQAPGAEPQHYEALIADGRDPAPLIVQSLVRNIGSEGSVVVWNKPFEAGRNQDLARHCPAHAEQLLGINERLFDLMLIFRDGHFIHPDFKGSTSLKAVLPALCPDLGYNEMAIPDGETAMLTWHQLHTGTIPAEERPKTIAAMKAYCKMDTFGMVAIWNKLQAL
jgi:hypothetical protein